MIQTLRHVKLSLPTTSVPTKKIINFTNTTQNILFSMTTPLVNFSGLSWPPNTRTRRYSYPPEEAKRGAQIWETVIWDERERD